MSQVVAVVSVFSTPELLPHFVRHYARLGIDRLCIALNCAFDIEPLRAEFGDFIYVKRTAYDRFTNIAKHEAEQAMLLELNVLPDDWVMHLDLDEFQQYPAHVKDIVAVAEARNVWAMMGYLYDRVAVDGILHPVRQDVPLDEQYSIGGWLTGNLVHGDTRKVMLCRRRVRLIAGRHDTTSGRVDRWPVGSLTNYRVHHFRWTDGLLDRLKTRWNEADQRSFIWARKNLEFVKNYTERGRINLAIKSLGSKPASMIYPERSTAIQQLARLNNSFGMDAAELEQLAQVVRSYRVQTVLEFGTGYSTAAFAGCRCNVISLEADERWYAKALPIYGHPLIDLRLYKAGHPIATDLAERRYDLCLIDGPRGGKPFARLDSVRYAMDRCDRLLIHDSKRSGEQDTLGFLSASGWKIEEVPHSRRGLAMATRQM